MVNVLYYRYYQDEIDETHTDPCRIPTNRYFYLTSLVYNLIIKVSYAIDRTFLLYK